LTDKIKNVAILICSHDGFSSLWEPLERSYVKYWPNCPLKIYLGTNFLEPDLKTFQTLAIGSESSWSDYILKCLDNIDEEYVLLTFDDVFWASNIDNNKLVPLIDQAMKERWNYLRFHPSPRGRSHFSSGLSYLDPGAQYRTSTALALFKKDVFISLLDRSETAWDFEIKGSRRSDHLDNFYVSREKILPYINLVVKSKVDTFAAKKLRRQGISLANLALVDMRLSQAISRKIYTLAYAVYRRIRDRFIF